MGRRSGGDSVAGETGSHNAMTLDPRDAFGFYCMGRACTLTGEHDAALTALERALELNPNFALTYFGLAFTLVWFGRAEEALPHLEKVILLSPNDPIKWSFEMIKGAALWWLGQFGEAVSVLGRARRHPNADFWPLPRPRSPISIWVIRLQPGSN